MTATMTCEHKRADECRSNKCAFYTSSPWPCFQKFFYEEHKEYNEGSDKLRVGRIDLFNAETCPKVIANASTSPCDIHLFCKNKAKGLKVGDLAKLENQEFGYMHYGIVNRITGRLKGGGLEIKVRAYWYSRLEDAKRMGSKTQTGGEHPISFVSKVDEAEGEGEKVEAKVEEEKRNIFCNHLDKAKCEKNRCNLYYESPIGCLDGWFSGEIKREKCFLSSWSNMSECHAHKLIERAGVAPGEKAISQPSHNSYRTFECVVKSIGEQNISYGCQEVWGFWSTNGGASKVANRPTYIPSGRVKRYEDEKEDSVQHCKVCLSLNGYYLKGYCSICYRLHVCNTFGCHREKDTLSNATYCQPCINKREALRRNNSTDSTDSSTNNERKENVTEMAFSKGDEVYLRGTGEGPFILIEQAQEPVKMWTRTPSPSLKNTFRESEVRVSDAWVAHARDGNLREIPTVLLARTKPERSLVTNVKRAKDLLAAPWLLNAAMFGTLVYLLATS